MGKIRQTGGWNLEVPGRVEEPAVGYAREKKPSKIGTVVHQKLNSFAVQQAVLTPVLCIGILICIIPVAS